MSTVLNNILPHLQFRRPALQRQSVLLPFHRIIHECIRRGIAIEVEPGLAQLELVAAQIGPHTKGLFPFNVESELMKVRPFVNIFVEVLHDQVWDHFMSGYSSKDFLRDPRIQSILDDSLMGLPLHDWLQWSMNDLFEHFVKVSQNILPAIIPQHFTKQLKTIAKRLPGFLKTSETLDTFLKNVYSHYKHLPIKHTLHSYIHDKLYSIPGIEPEVMYAQVRQLLILPPNLVACIREELICQEKFDRLNYALHQQNSIRRQRSKRFRVDLRKVSKHKRASRSSPSIKAQTRALEEAKKRLYAAEKQTAKLVHWYELGDQVAQQQHIYQKTFSGHHGIYGKTKRMVRQLVGEKAYTEEQREAYTNLKRVIAKQTETDPSMSLHHVDKNSTNPVTLLDYSLLQLIFAMLSPFHIYHDEWTGKPGFVAIIHHLNMLNVLPILARHIPESHHDHRYERHVRGIPLAKLDTKANREKYKRFANLKRELWCNIGIGLDDPVYPQDMILEEKQCYDPNVLYRTKKRTVKAYKKVEAQSHKKYGSRKSRLSHKTHADT